MRAPVVLLLFTLACFLRAQACDTDQVRSGCKIYGDSCICGYGCKTEYIYSSRRNCLNALRDVCSRMPCLRGICIQTAMHPGFSCKCEGTGFYGQRCEKACPTTALMRGQVFPHECIVI